ncbi:3-hydroxyacyl-CoA dehydrogenase family protein [Candidatus Enterovibrio altilux]|uniref:3-hydroxyacyl-CoA dehydrogenase family protein n=1 Tax=Candidatus Enterovibrio altilux TaxID=1927128 RepID=UPI001CC2575F|nr:3-hydroxyacyl-CoA dehydrogenase family protein [Candidatus Enterovibrio luxaltus]
MGPAYLLNFVDIDTAHHAQTVIAGAFPKRMAKNYHYCINVMFNNKRFSQKSGLSFYRYSIDHKGKPKKGMDDDVEILLTSIVDSRANYNEAITIDRMMVPIINGMARCLKKALSQPHKK